MHGVKGVKTLFLTGHPQLAASKTSLFIICMADICLRSHHRRHKLSGPISLFPALTLLYVTQQEHTIMFPVGIRHYVPSNNRPLCSQ